MIEVNSLIAPQTDLNPTSSTALWDKYSLNFIKPIQFFIYYDISLVTSGLIPECSKLIERSLSLCSLEMDSKI